MQEIWTGAQDSVFPISCRAVLARLAEEPLSEQQGSGSVRSRTLRVGALCWGIILELGLVHGGRNLGRDWGRQKGSSRRAAGCTRDPCPLLFTWGWGAGEEGRGIRPPSWGPPSRLRDCRWKVLVSRVRACLWLTTAASI